MPEKPNVRVGQAEVEDGKKLIRPAGSSTQIRIPAEVCDKLGVTNAVESLASAILSALQKSVESANPLQVSQFLSAPVLQVGGKPVAVEITGLKFKTLYEVESGDQVYGFATVAGVDVHPDDETPPDVDEA